MLSSLLLAYNTNKSSPDSKMSLGMAQEEEEDKQLVLFLWLVVYKDALKMHQVKQMTKCKLLIAAFVGAVHISSHSTSRQTAI